MASSTPRTGRSSAARIPISRAASISRCGTARGSSAPRCSGRSAARSSTRRSMVRLPLLRYERGEGPARQFGAPQQTLRPDDGCSGNPTVINPGAKYPRIDGSDVFSRQWSSYWIESGSYVRLRTLQVGYNLPPALIRWIPPRASISRRRTCSRLPDTPGSIRRCRCRTPAGPRRHPGRGPRHRPGHVSQQPDITIGISTTF